MKEFLDSDRVNFLIWRYLLEGNYRETAAKFQKEWHVHEPHRHFDFAPHVKSHALVSVINRGLLYLSLEREHAHKQAPREQPAAAEAMQVGVFGPVIAQPPQKLEYEDETGVEDGESHSRKRQSDTRPPQHQTQLNGSPAKKPRLSHGYENGGDQAPTPMEIDQNSGTADNNHAYPSPLEGEEVPTPIPRTDGPDQGTQVEKVQELAPETTFLRLMPDTVPDALLSSTVNGAGENAPILLHMEWHPRDQSILAAAGTDALARVWTISRGTAPEPFTGHVTTVNRPFHSLVDDEAPRNTTVTALAWNRDGSAVAVATAQGDKARINIWGPDGARIHCFDVSEPPVIKLRWSPNNAALLAIAPDKGGALVTVHHSATSNTLSFVLPNHDLNTWPLDAAWTNETDFLLCGGEVLLSLRCTDATIVLIRKFETRDDDNFAEVLFDWRSKLAATSSDKGVLDLWDESGQRRSISAHSGPITAMEWQPLQCEPAMDERLIASGGDDCAILIWNARIPESKEKCYLTMESPIVALAFTPDGAFIAGATSSNILIWKVGDQIPRASWSRAPHPGWLSPAANSEVDEEDEHRLGWDASGQKLAYGANSRLAVINFR